MSAESLPAFPPLDPNVVNDVDANRDRQIAFLRKALAEASRPSRAALLRYELNQVEGRIQLERE